MVGNVDRRIELDKNIMITCREARDHTMSKYIPLLSIMATKLSYENQAFVTSVVVQHWKVPTELMTYVYIYVYIYIRQSIIIQAT